MLFVSTDKGGTNLICDEGVSLVVVVVVVMMKMSMYKYILGVYTRNRNFRLLLSSKLGKTSCLALAPENEFKVLEYYYGG